MAVPLPPPRARPVPRGSGGDVLWKSPPAPPGARVPSVTHGGHRAPGGGVGVAQGRPGGQLRPEDV